MADELVEPQETSVPEPVPEQAEFFTQTVGEAMDAPPPAPEPEPEPKPAEPELPPVEPDWLNAAPEPEPPPQHYYQQPQYVEPQYPQQPQVPPQAADADAALKSFVDNPVGWVDNILKQREQQLVGPLAQQQQQVAQITSVLMNNYVSEGLSRADKAVRDAYKVFNQDSSFRANRDMQESLKATLQGMRQRAEYEARTTGNFEPLRTLANLDKSDMEATLAYMKAKAGVQSPGVAPLQVEGATVESSRAAVAEQGVELTPEEQEIARRMGPGYEARMKAAKVEQAKHDDLEWK